jgi:hypothetical protein
MAVEQTRSLVPERGLEPPLPYGNWLLRPVRLPIPPLGLPPHIITLLAFRRSRRFMQKTLIGDLIVLEQVILSSVTSY